MSFKTFLETACKLRFQTRASLRWPLKSNADMACFSQ